MKVTDLSEKAKTNEIAISKERKNIFDKSNPKLSKLSYDFFHKDLASVIKK
jgi:hypothetical protein